MATNIVAIGENNSKSQRPSSSAFKQQKLPAWQPILTAGTVLPTFFLIGVAFIPIGIGLLISSNQVQEYELNYTTCYQWFKDNNSYSGRLCADIIDKSFGRDKCICKINFTLNEDIRKDAFVYYGLTNFYQNHRRYVKSRDDRQLLGEKKSSSECEPYAHREDKIVAPCGAIANSLFNDTFRLELIIDKLKVESVPIVKTGIVWSTDKKWKFRNPVIPSGQTNLSYAFEGTIRPQNWKTEVWNLDPNNTNNNGYENEQLIVWMRTAALPTFRKLYGRIGHDKYGHAVYFRQSLPKGNYSLIIHYNFPVSRFKGTKHIIISNTSWLGGKNPFIGISYIVIGCFCLVLSAIFAFIHKKFGKSNNELLNVTQRTSYIG